MNRLVILISILFISTPILPAQSDNCTSVTKHSHRIAKNFSKMDRDDVRHQIDSLYAIRDTTCTKSMIYLNTVMGRLAKSDGQLDSALMYYYEGERYAEKINYVFHRKELANLISAIYFAKDKIQESYDIKMKAISIPCPKDSILCHKTNLKIRINNAVSLRYLDKHLEALRQCEDILIEMDSLNVQDSIYKLVIHNLMGTIYEAELDDDSKAIEAFKNALRTGPIKHPMLFSAHNNIGNSYLELGEIDSARYYLNNTIANTTIPKYLITPYGGLGDIAYKESNYTAAIEYYTQAVSNGEKSGITRLMYNAKGLLAKTYYTIGSYDQASSLFSEIFDYYDNEDNNLPETDLNDIEKYSILTEASIINPSLGKRLERFHDIRDSLAAKDRQLELDASLARIEKRAVTDSLKIATLQLSESKLTAKNQWLSILSLIFGLLLTIIISIALFRKYRKQREDNQALIFKQKELDVINNTLKEKIKTLTATKSIPTTKTIQAIDIPVLNRKYILKPEDIRYLEAENAGSRIYLKEETIWTDLSVKNVSNKLPIHNFVQISRGIIVNISYVQWVNHSSLKLITNEELKIGRTYKKEILSKFGN